MLPPQLFTTTPPTDLSSKVRSDPFTTLSYDILHLLLTRVATPDIISLAAASHHINLQIQSPSFWKSMLRTRIILPWFPELEDLCTTTLFPSPELDFKKLFLWLYHVTNPHFGMQGPFVRIANRRRIWNAVQGLVTPYFEQVKALSSSRDKNLPLDLLASLSG
jgi:hypothetical protein